MANISKITLPDGNTYDLKDGKKSGIYFVNGTQTESTGDWTGDIDVEELYDGLTIAYHLPYAGSGNASLQLTLSDGTTTDNLPVYFTGTTRCSTHYGAGSTILLTYMSADSSPAFTSDRWTSADYNTNDPNYRLRTAYYHRKKSLTVCYRYLIILTVSDTEAIAVNTVDRGTSNNSKVLTTQSFDPFKPISYYAYTTTVLTNEYWPSGYIYEAYELVDLRYSFNTGTTLIASKPVYMVCVPQSDGLVKLYSDPIVQDLPTSADGLYYIYLGMAYDTYRINLELHKPVYYFKNGRIRQLVDDARTINGYTVNADVPANAAFTDTDTKVTNTLATTTKSYITGTATATTNTGTQNFDTGVYLTTTAGQLNATTYKVNEKVTMQWNSTTESLDFIFN